MRRGLILAAGLLLAAMPASARPDCPDSLIDQAFLLAFPVSELVRTRAAALGRAAAAGPAPLNRFRHRQSLSSPADRGVTTPNVDTLYSSAWFDLSAGPLVLDMPATASRYVSIAIMDMAGDHLAILHSGGHDATRVALVRQVGSKTDQAGKVVRLPVDRGWIIARVFVAGPHDLAAARSVQAAISLSGPVPALPSGPAGNDTAAELLASVNAELSAGPPPPALARELPKLGCTGLGRGADGWQGLPDDTRSRWQERMPQLLTSLKAGFATEAEAGGWRRAHPATGRPDAPPQVRAAIALSGLGALPTSEALYYRTDRDAQGKDLNGRHRYAVRIPAQMPAEAFWSLTLYERLPDGRLFLAANRDERYAINSASAGLGKEPDGSMLIMIGGTAPHDRSANWLPAPAGPISLVLRLYQPRREALDGRFIPPPVALQAEASPN
jgi:hypothetical protein